MNNELEALGEILKKYHIEPQKPVFKDLLALPIVGSINSGKSSLVNALCGQRLLPAFIISRLEVPFYLSHASSGLRVTVTRHGREQLVGLHDLFDSRFDIEGVESVEIKSDSIFLQKIPGLTLVDMPSAEHILTIDDNALAAVLVFAADEPVIKEGLVRFFMSSGLKRLPLYVVITKCDKVTKADSQKAKDFFARNIPLHLGVTPVSICCASAKGDCAELNSVREMFFSIQQTAERTKRRREAKFALESCEAAIKYLSHLLLLKTFTLSELEGSYETECLTTKRILTALKEYDSRFFGFAQTCKESMLNHANEVLTAHAPLLLLVDEQYIYTLVKGAVAGAYNSELKPLLQSYLTYAQDLIRIHKLTYKLENPTQQMTLDLSGCPRFFDIVPERTKHSHVNDSKLQTNSKLQQEIKGQLEEYLNRLIDEHISAFTKTVSDMIQTESENRRRMLDEIHHQKEQDEFDRKTATEALTSELNTLYQIKDVLHAICKNANQYKTDEQP